MEGVLRECERSEQSAFNDLQQKVLKSVLHGGGGGGAPSAANATAPAEPSGAKASHEGNGGGGGGGGEVTLETLKQQAAAAREEAAALRAELEAAQAQLAQQQDGAGRGAAEGTPAAPTDAERNSGQPSSGRRACRPSDPAAQGAASPVVFARQSVCDGPDSGMDPASSAQRPRSRLHMSSLAEDEMGQVTPLGAAGGGGGRESMDQEG